MKFIRYINSCLSFCSLGLIVIITFLACGGKNPANSQEESQSKLVFVMTDTTIGSLGLYTMNLDGSELNPIAVIGDSIRYSDTFYFPINMYAGCISPRWSPDGKKILCLYRAGVDVSDKLVIMNDNGSDKHILTLNYGEVYDPQWSPEGTHIFYYTGVIDTSGEDDKMFRITSDPPHLYEGDTIWFHNDYQWGTTEEEIYATARVNKRIESTYITGEWPENEIFVLDFQTGKILRRVTTNDIDEGGFYVSPNGEYVAIKRGKYKQPSTFYILSPDDGNILEIRILNYVDKYWNWADDSKLIVVALNENTNPYSNNYFLYIIDIHNPEELMKVTSFEAIQPDLFIPQKK